MGGTPTRRGRGGVPPMPGRFLAIPVLNISARRCGHLSPTNPCPALARACRLWRPSRQARRLVLARLRRFGRSASLFPEHHPSVSTAREHGAALALLLRSVAGRLAEHV